MSYLVEIIVVSLDLTSNLFGSDHWLEGEKLEIEEGPDDEAEGNSVEYLNSKFSVSKSTKCAFFIQKNA